MVSTLPSSISLRLYVRLMRSSRSIMVMQMTGRPRAIRLLAMAAARWVLPVPGGPDMNRPLRPGSGSPRRGSRLSKASA